MLQHPGAPHIPGIRQHETALLMESTKGRAFFGESANHRILFWVRSWIGSHLNIQHSPRFCRHHFPESKGANVEYLDVTLSKSLAARIEIFRIHSVTPEFFYMCPTVGNLPGSRRPAARAQATRPNVSRLLTVKGSQLRRKRLRDRSDANGPFHKESSEFR
jgi:hypothetical protein